jgi:hypothetical protein
MYDYSKILTERGLIPRVSAQVAATYEAVKPSFLAEPELCERMEGREGKFRQSHAWLFPFLGRKVRTPSGPGTLLQVFADRVTVVLDTELSRCAVFVPLEIAPCDWSF